MIIIMTIDEVVEIVNEVTFLLRCSRPDHPDDRQEILRLASTLIHPDSEESIETIAAIRNDIGLELFEKYRRAVSMNSMLCGLLSHLVSVDIMNDSGDIAFHIKL